MLENEKNTHIALFCTFIMSPMSALANENFYIGAKTGWVHGTNACESHRLACDNDALGGGVFAGYELSDWLALEAGYNYFGKMKADYPALANSNITAGYTG
ncbi:outer membrane beta-barrel protein [Aeromonas sobria]|uniref:outer membrane beta-barrel protein n=1 Tax=Aeromonas sobria TaxID=646 RepID=UPI0009E301D9|nr:outer membrane beta-barrel protein [Aeromonas sobria]MBS4689625.1 outer membrane beta-barrel protein [Aeromonas sobria]